MNVLNAVKRTYATIHGKYFRFSTKHPYVTSTFTGGCMLGTADGTAQYLSTLYVPDYEWDKRRTVALATFGFFYYGFVSRAIFGLYETFLGPGRPMVKTLFECVGHTYTLFIPSFYFITGTVKGNSPTQIKKQLKEEYFASASGTMAYWVPLCWINFKYCTLQTRILFLSTFSFIHKTGLSWYSNRKRLQKRLNQESKNKANQDLMY